MAEFTYYDILGLSNKATDVQIKEAYKERARYYHPDITTLTREVAQAQLKIINEAYSALSSPEKRKEYDADLIARKELSLLGEFGEVVEGLLQGKFKRSVDLLNTVLEQAPESDIPHGLLATAYHMQAIAAYETQKYKLAQKLLKQALDIGFEDIPLRRAIKQDLAVVDHRLRAPIPLTDLGTVVKELNSPNKHSAMRALYALSNSDFEGDQSKAVDAARGLASRSLYRDVRISALKALAEIDRENREVYALILDLYGPGREPHKLETLAKLGGKKMRPLASLLTPFFWETSGKLRLGVLGLYGRLRPKDSIEAVCPLLWSNSPEIQGKAGWILRRMNGWLGALLVFEPGPSGIKAKQEDLKKKFGSKAEFFKEAAVFWEQPNRRGELIRGWHEGKNPGNYLDYVMLAFYGKTAGTSEAVKVFLASYGEPALGMLLEASKDEDFMLRLSAMAVLKELKPPELLDVMLAALSDSKPLILKEAIEVLGNLGDSRAIDPLRGLYRHEDSEIVALVQEAVNKIRDYKPPTTKKRKTDKGFDDWNG